MLLSQLPVSREKSDDDAAYAFGEVPPELSAIDEADGPGDIRAYAFGQVPAPEPSAIDEAVGDGLTNLPLLTKPGVETFDFSSSQELGQ